ncbi:hypothetical protein Tco_0656277 [Tanacetum coccineum]
MTSLKEGPFQMGTISDVITGGTRYYRVAVNKVYQRTSTHSSNHFTETNRHLGKCEDDSGSENSVPTVDDMWIDSPENDLASMWRPLVFEADECDAIRPLMLTSGPITQTMFMDKSHIGDLSTMKRDII